jgi:threonine dehydratase
MAPRVEARRIEKDEARVLVHAYDDERVIAGQGTIAGGADSASRTAGQEQPRADSAHITPAARSAVNS